MKKIILFLYIALIFSILAFTPLITSYAFENSNKNTNLVILFTQNNIDNDVKDIITESGGKIISEISKIGCIEVECNPKLIPKIKKQNSVESLSTSNHMNIKRNIEVNSIPFYVNNLKSSYNEYCKNFQNNINSYNIFHISTGNLYEKYQWDIKKITNNGESFNIESGNHSIIIGIIDSGVDKDHPDLKENFLGGRNFIPKNFNNDNTENGDPNDVEDRFGHGTEVTGQIAANGRIKGIAPKIGFKAYRVFDQFGETKASICANAIISAVDEGVNVINLSFSAYYLDGDCKWIDKDTGKIYDLSDDMTDYSLLKRAIKYANDKNVIVVTSAGNEGLDCSDNKNLIEYFNKLYQNQGFIYSGIMYEGPGSIEGVINVSATDKNDNLSSYSNYGENFIDITAPGGDYGEKFDNNMCITTSMDNGYTFTLGTSFSAPKVSATIALIKCKYNNLTNKQVINRLYSGASQIKNSKYYGYGIVNTYNSLCIN